MFLLTPNKSLFGTSGGLKFTAFVPHWNGAWDFCPLNRIDGFERDSCPNNVIKDYQAPRSLEDFVPVLVLLLSTSVIYWGLMRATSM